MKCDSKRNMDLVSVGILLVLSLFSSLQQAESISPALLLTPLINQNKTNEARNRSAVNPSLFLNVSSHAGFLTIDPQKNSNTFFWYFPVEGQPVDRSPWIIWLQGGPGASSLAGLFDEVGPFEYKDGELKHRKYAWTNNHSMLFIDNPVGVGYSFTDKEEGYATSMEQYTTHLYNAVQQFLTIFPELRTAPLFIAGESYAGRYVPALAARILAAGLIAKEATITLEGLILGNPVLNREDIVNLTNVFYQWGLIDSQLVQYLKPLQDMYAEAVKKGNNELAVNLRDQLLDKLEDRSMQQQTFNLLVDDYKLEDFESFLAKEEIREALHVGDSIYHFHNDTVSTKLIPDFLNNASAIVEELLNKYKLLIYCGQLDLTAPCVPSAEARRTKWKWDKRDDFLNAPRVPWWYEETVAGYIKNGGGLEEALVRGAGHLAPIDKPAEVLVLVSSFIKNIEMDLPPNYEIEKPKYHPNTTIYVTTLPYNYTTTLKPEVKTTETPNTKTTAVTVKPEISTKDSLSADKSTASYTSSISAATIASIIFNVVLVLIVALGAFMYYRLKKRNEDFFYSNVENNSDELFMT